VLLKLDSYAWLSPFSPLFFQVCSPTFCLPPPPRISPFDKKAPGNHKAPSPSVFVSLVVPCSPDKTGSVVVPCTPSVLVSDSVPSTKPPPSASCGVGLSLFRSRRFKSFQLQSGILVREWLSLPFLWPPTPPFHFRAFLVVGPSDK